MRPVPGWAVISAILAPIFLLGGLVLARARQPASYNSTRDTISAMAGLGAPDRWIMGLGLAGLGLCYIATGLGLRPAAVPGRVVMVFGGVVSLLASFFPQPHQGTSEMHGIVAGAGFIALAVWPVFAFRPERTAPWPLRLTASLVATLVMIGLLFWFAAELFSGGGRVGLTERFLAGAEAVWPVVVVFGARQVGPALQGAVSETAVD